MKNSQINLWSLTVKRFINYIEIATNSNYSLSLKNRAQKISKLQEIKSEKTKMRQEIVEGYRNENGLSRVERLRGSTGNRSKVLPQLPALLADSRVINHSRAFHFLEISEHPLE